MSQYELQPQTRSWLRWEWRAALITIIGGFVIAAAYLGYMSYRAAHAPQPIAAEQQTRVNAEASLALCTAALERAKAFGIVPNYGKLASPGLRTTGVKGRYACLAATSVAAYTLAADLVCRDLRDQRCVALYSVTQQDGTVLYQRHS
jgi:hypothetical protein